MHIKLQQTVFSGFSRKHHHRISRKYLFLLFFGITWDKNHPAMMLSDVKCYAAVNGLSIPYNLFFM